MAVLFGVFGLLITLFAANGDIIIVAVVTVVAAILGYVIGKNMEREASHK